MDKEEKRRLKKLYKEQELQNLIKNNDGGIIGEVLSEYAQNKLGIKGEPLTEQDILEIEETCLIELIYRKLWHYLSWLYKQNPRNFKSVEKTLQLQPPDLIFIDAFYSFKSLHQNGGVENFLFNSTERELNEFKNGLIKFGLSDFLKVFRTGNEVKIFEYFGKHKESIEGRIVKYIKEHPQAFTLE
jgi:hypothetical protein